MASIRANVRIVQPRGRRPTVAKLREQLDAVTSERDCVATLVPGTDVIFMACTNRRCTRCSRLRSEAAKSAGWRDRVREEYEAKHPTRSEERRVGKECRSRW